jgi:hypothetical protein
VKHARDWKAAVAGAWCLLCSSTLLGAETPPQVDVMPSYMIPNVVALIMIAVVVSIACKPFKPIQ